MLWLPAMDLANDYLGYDYFLTGNIIQS
jgi:hypothetical protein